MYCGHNRACGYLFIRAPAGAAKTRDPAAFEDTAETETLHLEVRAGLLCHGTRQFLAQRTGAGGHQWTCQGQSCIQYIHTHSHTNFYSSSVYCLL